jgi:exopolysaccharide production protein ExoY
MENSASANTSQLPVNRVRKVFLLASAPHLQDKWSYRVAKRIFDILLACTLAPLVLPIVLVLMAVTKLSSSGPVFYRQQRIGQFGRPFFLYKFRTMVPDGDSLLARHLEDTPGALQEWEEHFKLRADPRVTCLGAALRRTSLDELPQLVNVLAGHMSFVGPRPVVEEELPRYGSALAYYTAAKPGITGLWQVSGRGTLSYEARVLLDMQYVKTWSLLQDLKVLFRTAAAVSRCDGAY